MFNLSGSEIIVILLLALVILGPEKLPEAMRKAGRAYSELRKMANSFQSEVRSALDEPVSELRGTADAIRDATQFSDDPKKSGRSAPAATRAPAAAAVGPTTTDADADPDDVDEPDDFDADDFDADDGPDLEPDAAAIDDVLDGDDDDAAGTGLDEDVVTRPHPGNAGPGPSADAAGPDS